MESYYGEVMDRCDGVSLNYRFDERMLDFDWSFCRDPFVEDNGSLAPEFLWVDGNFTSHRELPNTSQKKQSESNAIQGTAPLPFDFSAMQEDLMEEPARRAQGSCGNNDKDVLSIGAEKLICGVENQSTSSGTFNWATRSNADSSDNKGVLLIYVLIACAEAISNGSHDLAHILLCRLSEMVSVTGSTVQRVSFYLSRALRHRHQLSLGEHSMEVNLKPQQLRDVGTLSLLNQVFPFIRIPHFTANQSILEAIKGKRKKVHIMDFDIMEGMQWPPLMEALESGGYEIEQLKITALKWDCGDDDFMSAPLCTTANTGRMLSEYAASLGIPFSFKETAVENMKREFDEIVAVNCMWELPHMYERSRTQLSNFILGARRLDPVILTIGTGPPDDQHCQSINFLDSFNDCLRNLCAVFDCSEAALPERYAFARAKVEYLYLAPMVCMPLNCNEKFGPIKVLDIPPKCGFAAGDISKRNEMYANQMLLHLGFPMQYRVKCGDSQQLLLQWHFTVLSRVSVWKPITYYNDIIPAVYL